ncbi:MAG: NifU family protein [Actinomycetota bacterium]|nr:NifU family protein [Actinomycetota bacterium]
MSVVEHVVTVSQIARDMVIRARSGQEGAESYALWVEVTGNNGPDYTYELYLHPLEYATADDLVQRHDDLSVVIVADSVEKLRGASIDYGSGPQGEGWVVDNPNHPQPLLSIGKSPSMGVATAPVGDLSSEVAQRVHQVLEQQINPMIAAHGGRADLVSVDGSRAYLRLGGGCQGCGMATVTLSQGIEVAIKEAVPEITEVVDVTDHASGTNPYFESSKK